MFDRAEHCRRIASLGGKAVVKKYGKDHMREIGEKGAKATHALYSFRPVGTSKWVMVGRKDGLVKTEVF